jgi:hypothetical protein
MRLCTAAMASQWERNSPGRGSVKADDAGVGQVLTDARAVLSRRTRCELATTETAERLERIIMGNSGGGGGMREPQRKRLLRKQKQLSPFESDSRNERFEILESEDDKARSSGMVLYFFDGDW